MQSTVSDIVSESTQEAAGKVRARRRVGVRKRTDAARFSAELALAVARNAAKERLADALVGGGQARAGGDWKKGRQWHLERVRALLAATGARKAVGYWLRLRLFAEPEDGGVRSITYERVALWVAELVAEVLLAVDEAERHGNLVEWLCSSAAVPTLWGKAITTHRGAVLVGSVPGLGYAVLPPPEVSE